MSGQAPKKDREDLAPDRYQSQEQKGFVSVKDWKKREI